MTNDASQGPASPRWQGSALLAATLLTWLFLRLVEATTSPLDGPTRLFTKNPPEAVLPWTASPLVYAAALCLTTLVGLTLTVAMTTRTRPQRLPLSAVAIVCTAVALLNVLHLPYLSNDLFLYRAFGLVQAKGMNPYLVAPSHVLPLDDVLHVPFVDQVAAYGPLALLMFRGAVLAGGGPAHAWLLKLLMALPAVLAALLVSRRALDERRPGVLAYVLLCPLVVLELLGTGHLEGWIALFLLLAVAALSRPTGIRALGAGVLIGLAASIKLPALLCLGPCAGLLARHGQPRRASRLALLLAGAGGALSLLYAPYWAGSGTFEGLLRQSELVRRSLHFLVLQLTGVRHLATGLAVSGGVLAALVGLLASLRGRGLAVSTALALGIQALLGRTFFQPWSLCPLVFLGAWALAEEPARGAPATFDRLDELFVRLLLPVLSASAVIGAYVPYILVDSPGTATEHVSIALILGLPALALLVARRRHGRAIAFR